MGIRRTDPACFCSQAISRIIPIPKDWTIHAVLNKTDHFIDLIKMREARRQGLPPHKQHLCPLFLHIETQLVGSII